MALTDNAKNYIKKAFWADSPLKETDPEFYEFFYNFAYDEVQNFGDLDEKTGYLSVLAVLLGCGGFDEFKVMLPAALNCGVTPEEAREVVYQATAYLCLGRVYVLGSVCGDVDHRVESKVFQFVTDIASVALNQLCAMRLRTSISV